MQQKAALKEDAWQDMGLLTCIILVSDRQVSTGEICRTYNAAQHCAVWNIPSQDCDGKLTISLDIKVRPSHR